MNFKNIEFTIDKQGIAVLTINRPNVLNVINIDTLNEIDTCLEYNKMAVRYLILTGTGRKSFIAGGDIKEYNNMTKDDFENFLRKGQSVTKKIENGNYISLACVNGYALGGGFEFALSCDFIFASENASFGFPEVKLGIIPGFGGTVRISRRIGLHKAKELVLSGNKFNVDQSLAFGFINRVTSLDDLIKDAHSFLIQISENSFNAMLSAKNLLNSYYYHDINSLLASEMVECSNCFNSNDRVEGVTAFSEKRKPDFNNLI